MKRLRHVSLLFLLCSLSRCAAAADRQSLITQGDEAFNRRAENHQGCIADPRPVSDAIEDFQQALQQDPQNLEARWKLIRAMIFKGHYAVIDMSEKKKIFAQGKTIADEGMKILGALVQKETGQPALSLALPDRAAALKKYPGSGELAYYAGTVWAEWSNACGIMSAIRQGSAAEIRDDAMLTSLIDEQVRYGGGYRTLGRLYHLCPKVPFLTGWISHDKALEYLEKAYQLAPKRKFNRVYLAEALHDLAPARRAEAVALLKQVIADAPDEDLSIEDLTLQDQARTDLGRWGSQDKQ